MKISLSKPELLAIVSAELGYKVTEITITKQPTLHLELEAKVSQDIGVSGGLNQSLLTRGDLKIPAIKSLRTHNAGMGLAEAKWAVENWSQWIDFVKVNGKAPKMEFGGNWNGVPILS
jgi:hypothetical protein